MLVYYTSYNDREEVPVGDTLSLVYYITIAIACTQLK